MAFSFSLISAGRSFGWSSGKRIASSTFFTSFSTSLLASIYHILANPIPTDMTKPIDSQDQGGPRIWMISMAIMANTLNSKNAYAIFNFCFICLPLGYLPGTAFCAILKADRQTVRKGPVVAPLGCLPRGACILAQRAGCASLRVPSFSILGRICTVGAAGYGAVNVLPDCFTR